MASIQFSHIVSALALPVILIAGCSSSPQSADAFVEPDGAAADLPVDAVLDLPDDTYGEGDLAPVTCVSKVGTHCTELGGECGPVGTCLLSNEDAAGKRFGVCTCECVIDETDIMPRNPPKYRCPKPGGPQLICGEVTKDGAKPKHYCFRRCSPTLGKNECSNKFACTPRSGASFKLRDAAVCAFSGCAKDSDCPVLTSTACDTAKQSCPAGEMCVALTAGAADGVCAKRGKCDLISGLCDLKPAALSKATAKVGDPCKDDTECAPNQSCQSELDLASVCLARDSAGVCTKKLAKSGATCTKDEACCSGGCTNGTCEAGRPCGVLNRNGYCITSGCTFASSLTQFACDAGSTCTSLFAGGICYKTCDLTKAGECRGNANDLWGDYECRGWDGLSMGSVPISAAPYCEPGFNTPCDIFGTSGTLDCGVLGDKTNSTKMGCRTLGNKATAVKFAAGGFCFDDTASGSTVRNPLP